MYRCPFFYLFRLDRPDEPYYYLSLLLLDVPCQPSVKVARLRSKSRASHGNYNQTPRSRFACFAYLSIVASISRRFIQRAIKRPALLPPRLSFGGEEKIAKKRAKGRSQKLPRERRSRVHCSTFSLSLRIGRSVARGSVRGRKEERSIGERRTKRTRDQKEGQTGRSERGTRGCHGYRRIPASPRCHGDAA